MMGMDGLTENRRLHFPLLCFTVAKKKKKYTFWQKDPSFETVKYRQ